MERGYAIASLAWPNELFSAKRPFESRHPHPAPWELRDVPFRHWKDHNRWIANLNLLTYLDYFRIKMMK